MSAQPRIQALIAGTPRVGVPGVEVGDNLDITANNSGYLIYQVTSGRKFKLANLTITNQALSNILLTLYDATSALSNRLLNVLIGAYKTENYPPLQLIGTREAISGIYGIVSISGTTTVHVGGFEV